MSSHESAPLPPAWVERIFKRLAGMYGAQKFGAMWAGTDMEDAKELWAEQLGRYRPESIGAALQRLIDSGGNGWPPTLPEFVELCRQCSVERSGQALALPEPRRSKPDGVDLTAAFRGGDPLRWARVVGSLTAARALVQASQRDSRLREILDAHAAKDFAGLGTPVADYLRRAHALLRETA